MAFCCFPTLFKKINSELVAIRFGGKRRKSEQQSEKKGGIREDNKEIAENPTFVQLVSLVGNKERAMKESSEKAESEKEGRSKSKSFNEKADDLDECKLRYIFVQNSSTFKGTKLKIFHSCLHLHCFQLAALVGLSWSSCTGIYVIESQLKYLEHF